MPDVYFKIIGALGLLCIAEGVLIKSIKKEEIMFIIGGILLEIYSWYLGDWIFMTLQLVFVAAAAWRLARK